MPNNIVTRTDSYKFSHFQQYPKNVEFISSYIESRGIDENQFMIPPDAEVVMFGLQVFIKKYLSTPVTMEMVDYAQKRVASHGEPFNYEGWKSIVENFKGVLPIEIKAVPEGTPMKPKNVMVQVKNTVAGYEWLVSLIEMMLLRDIWYMSTVATVSREAKKVIYKFLEKTSDYPDDIISTRLHDFGGRGVSSGESAEHGGLAHLVNFIGTDTFEAVIAAEDYYNTENAGFSIPASEHSTMTINGRDGELGQMELFLDTFGGKFPFIACVSDSYDIYNAVTNYWGGALKEKVEKSGSTLVIRPDSGDPVETPIWCVKELGRIFGYTTNNKGFKVLNNCVRVIQGDGINPVSIEKILVGLKVAGYSAENIAFGMGGALLQKVNRDTLKFAMKASAQYSDGKWHDVFKQPVDEPFKISKKGSLALVKEDGEYKTIREDELGSRLDLLKTVWINGAHLIEYTLDEVRENAKL